MADRALRQCNVDKCDDIRGTSSSTDHVVLIDLPTGNGSEFIVAASVTAAERMSATNSWDADWEREVAESL